MTITAWLQEEEKYKPVGFSASPKVREKLAKIPRTKRSDWINAVLTKEIEFMEGWNGSELQKPVDIWLLKKDGPE